MKPKIILCLALVLSGNCFAAIIYPKEPDGGRQMVMIFVNSFVQKNLPPFRGMGTTNGITLSRPIPWCGMNLETTQLTSIFEPEGNWFYVIMHGSNVVGNVDLEADTTGKALKCTSLGDDSKGGYIDNVIKALRIAEQWPQVQTNDYKVGLIGMNIVSFLGIWLHNESNGIVIPLPPTYNRFDAYQSYSEGEIIKVLAPEAKRDAEGWASVFKQENKDHAAYAKAMNDYEKAHGGECGDITLLGMSAPFQNPGPHIQIFTLVGKSSACGKLQYKVKVTYQNQFDVVKSVEILEKLPDKTP